MIRMKNAGRFLWLGSGFIACGLSFASWSISSVQAQPYVVYVPGGDLRTVRSVAPDAFPTTIQGQQSVQAGAFNSPGNADSLVNSLRQAGLPAQRIYRSESISTYPATFPTTYPVTTSYPTTINTSYPTTPAVLPPVTSNISTATPYSNGLSGYQTTDASGNPIQPQQFRYITIVPTGPRDSDTKLSQVRRFVPSAFLANSSRGSYIYAGVYSNREGAEALSYYLRSQGLDARVAFF